MRKKPKTVAFRRRREGKTDYERRLRLLLSKKPRLVVRPSLKTITAQLVAYEPKGDHVLLGLNSVFLKKLNWPYSLSNLPAAYLTGLRLGRKALSQKMTEAVLDIGLKPSVKGSAIYACLKGALDAGMLIPYDKDILPNQDRISGKHMADFKKDKKIQEDFKEIKEQILKQNG